MKNISFHFSHIEQMEQPKMKTRDLDLCRTDRLQQVRWNYANHRMLPRDQLSLSWQDIPFITSHIEDVFPNVLLHPLWTDDFISRRHQLDPRSCAKRHLPDEQEQHLMDDIPLTKISEHD